VHLLLVAGTVAATEADKEEGEVAEAEVAVVATAHREEIEGHCLMERRESGQTHSLM